MSTNERAEVSRPPRIWRKRSGAIRGRKRSGIVCPRDIAVGIIASQGSRRARSELNASSTPFEHLLGEARIVEREGGEDHGGR